MHAQTVVTRSPFGPGYEADSSYTYYLMYEATKLHLWGFSSAHLFSLLQWLHNFWLLLVYGLVVPAFYYEHLLDFFNSEHFILGSRSIPAIHTTVHMIKPCHPHYYIHIHQTPRSLCESPKPPPIPPPIPSRLSPRFHSTHN